MILRLRGPFLSLDEKSQRCYEFNICYSKLRKHEARVSLANRIKPGSTSEAAFRRGEVRRSPA